MKSNQPLYTSFLHPQDPDVVMKDPHHVMSSLDPIGEQSVLEDLPESAYNDRMQLHLSSLIINKKDFAHFLILTLFKVL